MLNRLKIRTRIYVGFGSLILLALAVAGAGSLGIEEMGQQTGRIISLTGNIHYVDRALDSEELIARLLLRASINPADDIKARFNEAQAAMREAVSQAKTKALSQERKDIYQSVLERMDPQARSAEKSFETGSRMIAARAKLFALGDPFTATAARLVEAAGKTLASDVIAAASAVERNAILVRVANWRFLAIKNAEGPATLHTNVAATFAALDALEKLDAPGLAPMIKAVRDALGAYRDGFDAVAPALLGLGELYETEQRPAANAIQADLERADGTLTRDVNDAMAAFATVRETTTGLQIGVASAGLLFGLVLAFFIGRSITKPIFGMTATMGQLAGGEHDVTIPGTENRDEIGEMARAVEVFKINMIEADRLAVEQEAARTARSRRQDAMDHHTQVFGTSVTGVMAALGIAAANMRKAADVMTETAAAVHQEASETAGGAGKSSADLTAVAAAVEEFTASVGEISRQVAVASEVAAQAVQKAEASQATIRGLAESTARIGDVVRLIDSIAGQTNLLALNATIEAARAGEAGKGFAVVASEVKALANQTARATAEIGAQIETVRSATDETVVAMNEIGGIISRMGEVSTAISAAVEEQAVTTREIASSIQGVAGSTAQAAHAMEHVVQMADRAGDASRQIVGDTNEIGVEASKLRQEVETFLQAVNNDSGERRRFERIAGNVVTATLRIPGASPAKTVVQDISRSGIALRFGGAIAAGREIEVDLPDAGGTVAGRVTRVGDGVVAIAFDEDKATLARVERVLAGLSLQTKAA